MKVKELCCIAIMAAIEMVVFTSFSFILYIEFITFTVVVFSMVFSKRMAVLSAVIFGLLNMILIQSVTPWSICYLLIYPSYSWIISSLKAYLSNHFISLCILCGMFSFLTGQILQLPFMLFSKYVTLVYLIIGLKTSLIQGVVSMVGCMVLYKPVEKVLKIIEKRIL